MCTRFNSLFFDPLAEACDAFTQDWSGDNNFANPDFNDIPRVLAHAARYRCKVTLIFPGWVSKPWYLGITQSPALLELLTLPPVQSTFIAGPRSSIFASGVPNWSTFAARLDFALLASQTPWQPTLKK
jgi:hypothetical protein